MIIMLPAKLPANTSKKNMMLLLPKLKRQFEQLLRPYLVKAVELNPKSPLMRCINLRTYYLRC
jgi:hypothetical protein